MIYYKSCLFWVLAWKALLETTGVRSNAHPLRILTFSKVIHIGWKSWSTWWTRCRQAPPSDFLCPPGDSDWPNATHVQYLWNQSNMFGASTINKISFLTSVDCFGLWPSTGTQKHGKTQTFLVQLCVTQPEDLEPEKKLNKQETTT